MDCCLGYSVVNSGLALCSCYGNLLIDLLHLRKLYLVYAILYFCRQNSLYDIYDTFIWGVADLVKYALRLLKLSVKEEITINK